MKIVKNKTFSLTKTGYAELPTQPKTQGKMIERFAEKYQSFELGEPVYVDQFKKLKAFLQQELERVAESARKEERDFVNVQIIAGEETRNAFIEENCSRSGEIDGEKYSSQLNKILSGAAISEYIDRIKKKIIERDALAQSKECDCECHVLGENYPCKNPNCSQSKGEGK